MDIHVLYIILYLLIPFQLSGGLSGKSTGMLILLLIVNITIKCIELLIYNVGYVRYECVYDSTRGIQTFRSKGYNHNE